MATGSTVYHITEALVVFVLFALLYAGTHLSNDDVSRTEDTPQEITQPREMVPSITNYPVALRSLITKANYTGLSNLLYFGDTLRFTLCTNPVNESIRWAYATLESADTISGVIGTQIASWCYEFQHTFDLPGTYSISIDLITPKGFIPVQDRRGFNISVTGASFRRREKPRCRSGPTDNGLWLRCGSTFSAGIRNCLRWGWVFEPSDCHYEIWSHGDLKRKFFSNSKAGKRWIVFLGDSVMRGVFLSAVDLLLNTTGGELHTIAKCWGRLDVEWGRIRLTYQDFRAFSYGRYPPWSSHQDFECHGNVTALDFFQLQENGTEFMRRLFSSTTRAPTAVVFPLHIATDPRIASNLLQLPQSYTGQLIAIAFPNLVQSIGIPPQKVPPLMQEAQSIVFLHPVDFVYAPILAIPLLRTGEGGVTSLSQHWHRDTRQGEPWGIDGLLTDMLAQVVFNQALGAKLPGYAISSSVEESRICMDCPPGLLPFHIYPEPNMTCHSGVIGDRTNISVGQHVHAAPKCPESCMQRRPTHNVATQSGVVEGRICHAEVMP
ncbi:hypothetical protein DFJ74DRAFT_156942 [Hyaloraphidium curvatum]|nr:hypothetical protein DFJ74DRAFT_156942 [Hyaloraphidium curvatum]